MHRGQRYRPSPFSFSSFTSLIPSTHRRHRLIRGQQSTLAYADTHSLIWHPPQRLCRLKPHTIMKHSAPFLSHAPAHLSACHAQDILLKWRGHEQKSMSTLRQSKAGEGGKKKIGGSAVLGRANANFPITVITFQVISTP